MDKQRSQQDLQRQVVVLKKISKISVFCMGRLKTSVEAGLTDGDRELVRNCMDRYFDAETFLMERLQAKARQMQGQSLGGHS